MKRISVLVLVALVAARLQLAPSPGRGSGRSSRCTSAPPGAQRCARRRRHRAPTCRPGTAAATTVWLDRPGGRAARHRHDAAAALRPRRRARVGPGVHSLYRRRRASAGTSTRHGLAFVDTALRLNQMQALGTHNSYHVYPLPPIDGIQQLQYFQDPLDVQLQSAGRPPVRARRVREHRPGGHVPGAPHRGRRREHHVQGVRRLPATRSRRGPTRTRSTSRSRSSSSSRTPTSRCPNLPYRPWVASDLDTLDAKIRSVFTGEPAVHARRPARHARDAARGDRAGRLADDRRGRAAR